jgi:hypothetical protein
MMSDREGEAKFPSSGLFVYLLRVELLRFHNSAERGSRLHVGSAKALAAPGPFTAMTFCGG